MNEKTPSTEAMKIVSDIRRIDAYGDSSVIACLTYSEAAQLIENYGAAQRQAGREEAKAYIAELECEVGEYHEIRAKDGERYAALVEAAKKSVHEGCDHCEPPCEGCAYYPLAKALSDLGEVRKW